MSKIQEIILPEDDSRKVLRLSSVYVKECGGEHQTSLLLSANQVKILKEQLRD